MSASASIAAPRLPVAPQDLAFSRGAVAPAPPQVSAAPPKPAPGPNPSLRVDPQLGIVVLEFEDGQGKTVTLPTQRMLAAYRLQGGPSPPHRGDAKAAEPVPTKAGAPAPAAETAAAPPQVAPATRQAKPVAVATHA